MPYILRGILIHLLYENFTESADDFGKLISYLEILITSKREVQNYLEGYLVQLSRRNFQALVRKIQSYINLDFSDDEMEASFWEAITVLDVFYKANYKREDDDQISYKEFYNEIVNNNVNLADQYEDWLQGKQQM